MGVCPRRRGSGAAPGCSTRYWSAGRCRWGILIPPDSSNESLPLQCGDSLPRRRFGAVTIRRDVFHGCPALFLLPCTAHQEVVHRELDGCQMETKKCVAEFEKPFSLNYGNSSYKRSQTDNASCQYGTQCSLRACCSFCTSTWRIYARYSICRRAECARSSQNGTKRNLIAFVRWLRSWQITSLRCPF